MDYKRKFIILNREDEKYCEKGATGYCKIETYNSKSHIKIFLQGIKSLDNNRTYKVYLISHNFNKFKFVCIGNIDVKNSKGELITEVDEKNVLSSELDINKFNIVAIYIKDSFGKNIHQYPLVGYDKIEKIDEWKYKINSEFDAFDKTETIKPNIQVSADKKGNNISKDNSKEDKQIESNKCLHNNDYYSYLQKGDYEQLNQIMKNIRGVSEINPFTRAKLKYKWWKISNMEFFDSILKNNIMASQIFKHPLIKKKIREENYCLYGLVSDVSDTVKYMAFGFPSKYYTNDQIYIGGFSVFYPAEGFEKKNGDYGYWVVHIKIDSKNIVMTV